MLRLRLPALDDAAYAALARTVRDELPAGLRLILDRDPALSRELGCGYHATEAAWRPLQNRPVPAHCPFTASAHDRAGLLRLVELGVDAAVLGNVLATATHPGRQGIGWTGFAQAAAEAGLPVYAIGGVGPSDHHQAWESGGQGCAGIGAYWR